MTAHSNETRPLETKVQSHEWGTLEWRVDDSLVAGAGISVAMMTLLKGKTSPLHRHPNSHEFIYVNQGRVEVSLDGQKAVLNAGDSLLSPPGAAHGLKNLGEMDAQLVLSYSSGKRIYEQI